MTTPNSAPSAEPELQQFMSEGDAPAPEAPPEPEPAPAEGEAQAAPEGEQQTPEGDKGEGSETPSEPQQPTPDEVTRLRQENQRLQREAQERQRQAEETQVQQAATQYAQRQMDQYAQQGYDDQTARQLAVADARAAMSEYRAQRATLRSTALELSQQYGVPRDQLEAIKDEASMRHYAEHYHRTVGPQAKELQELRREVAELKKGQVPAQEYTRPSATTGSGSNQQIWEAYGRGETGFTERVRKAGEALGYL